jgi:DNA-binding NarL/FixJ family response regulator
MPSVPPPLVLVETEPIRVLIADRQPVVRAGFTAMLAAEDDLAVAGEAAGAEEAIALARRLRPSVVLIDLDLEGGLEAARWIAESLRSAVMILDAQDDDEGLLAALRAGARAVMPKRASRDELVDAVRVIAGGGARLDPGATRRLIAEYAAQPQPHLPTLEQLDDLTAREREVIAMVASGLRNDEIAERFVISPATVKTHVSRLLRKLDAHDRAQLVAIAYQLGLVRWSSRAPRRALRGMRRPAVVT